MPWGATEEPEVIETERQSIPVHVVSSDARPSRSAGTEYGRWRTFNITNALGNDSATPGAQRLLNRSLRRHRALIVVESGGLVTPSVASFPSIAVSGTAVQNPFAYPVSVVLSSFTATQVFINGILAGAGNGTYIVPAYGSLSVTFTVLGTTTPSGIPQPQSALDGVIIGGRDEINSGQPATPGKLGGFLPIGSNIRYEAQPEMWACYPATNTGPVLVSVCDEVYASDPEAWRNE